jgi:hypothetical protein
MIYKSSYPTKLLDTVAEKEPASCSYNGQTRWRKKLGEMERVL